MEVRALRTVLSFDFNHEIPVHGDDRRVNQRACLLHPPIFPVEIASTRSHKAAEEMGRGDRNRVVTGSRLPGTPRTREAGQHDVDARSRPPPPRPPPAGWRGCGRRCQQSSAHFLAIYSGMLMAVPTGASVGEGRRGEPGDHGGTESTLARDRVKIWVQKASKALAKALKGSTLCQLHMS